MLTRGTRRTWRLCSFVWSGSAWGVLYESQTGKKISSGLTFDAPIGPGSTSIDLIAVGWLAVQNRSHGGNFLLKESFLWTRWANIQPVTWSVPSGFSWFTSPWKPMEQPGFTTSTIHVFLPSFSTSFQSLGSCCSGSTGCRLSQRLLPHLSHAKWISSCLQKSGSDLSNGRWQHQWCF